MVLYTCDKCNKTFKQKSNYIYHINRKRPCNSVAINEMNSLELDNDELSAESHMAVSPSRSQQISPKSQQTSIDDQKKQQKVNKHQLIIKKG